LQIDYPARLAAARARMAAQGIELMFLRAGANLFYLTGIQRHEEGGTDHNAYGDWAVGGYLGPSGGVTLLAPRMGGGYFDAEARDKPWIEAVRHIDESESPFDVMRQTVGHYIPAGSGPSQGGTKLALDDRAWAKSVFAFRQLLPDAKFVLASDVTMPLRMIKSPAELGLMRKAGEITDGVREGAGAAQARRERARHRQRGRLSVQSAWRRTYFVCDRHTLYRRGRRGGRDASSVPHRRARVWRTRASGRGHRARGHAPPDPRR